MNQIHRGFFVLLTVVAFGAAPSKAMAPQGGQERPQEPPQEEPLVVNEQDPQEVQEETPQEKVQETVPYSCDRFEVHMNEEGHLRYKRLQKPWTQDDRQRFRKLIVFVAQEFGADPKLLTLWALRESTYNPYAIHVLNPDIEASAASWEKHRWDPKRAAELEEKMTRLGARDPEYWEAKAELARISRFRNNPYFETLIEYTWVGPENTKAIGQQSAWSYGYGPFGFNPTYFLPIWDETAPPWVFCQDDGLAAIVTAIWAAREHQRECIHLGYEGTNEVVNRRFSSGHCSPRPDRSQKFFARARKRGLDPEAQAVLGNRWPSQSSDRQVLLSFLRAKAEQKGLLPSN